MFIVYLKLVKNEHYIVSLKFLYIYISILCNRDKEISIPNSPQKLLIRLDRGLRQVLFLLLEKRGKFDLLRTFKFFRLTSFAILFLSESLFTRLRNDGWICILCIDEKNCRASLIILFMIYNCHVYRPHTNTYTKRFYRFILTAILSRRRRRRRRRRLP